MIVSTATLFPAETGTKFTVITCDPFGVVVKTIGETANMAESAPLRVMLDTTRLAVPTLDTVNVFCENEPTKVESIANEVGALIPGVGCAGTVFPNPLTFTTVEPPLALWLIVRIADFAPTVTGANETVMVWLAPNAIVAVVGKMLNMAASVPIKAIPDTTRLAVPVLVITNVFCDVEPTMVVSIINEVGTEMAGLLTGGGVVVFPTPDITTWDGEPAAL